MPAPPFAVGVQPIPRDARPILRDGDPPARDLIEKRAFPHVGAPHEGDQRICHISLPAAAGARTRFYYTFFFGACKEKKRRFGKNPAFSRFGRQNSDHAENAAEYVHRKRHPIHDTPCELLAARIVVGGDADTHENAELTDQREHRPHRAGKNAAEQEHERGNDEREIARRAKQPALAVHRPSRRRGGRRLFRRHSEYLLFVFYVVFPKKGHACRIISDFCR